MMVGYVGYLFRGAKIRRRIYPSIYKTKNRQNLSPKKQLFFKKMHFVCKSLIVCESVSILIYRASSPPVIIGCFHAVLNNIAEPFDDLQAFFADL